MTTRTQTPDTAAPGTAASDAAATDEFVADAPLLELDGLTIDVDLQGRSYRAVDALDLTIGPRQAMGLVGESGSGKSLTLRAIMGLLPPNINVTSGAIRFRGDDLVGPDTGERIKQVRGTGMAMVFQEPAVALNPIARVGSQIVDAAVQHRGLGRKEAREYAIHLMDQVGITDPGRRVDSYPFELSGGMRQRVMIAAAVAGRPQLLLCDEPTTALDVTVQAQILALFASLREELDMGLLYVTHDLAVVGQVCDALTVLYAGERVEAGPLRQVFDDPRHPYTRALLGATPRIDGPITRLSVLSEAQPALTDRPAGEDYPRRWPDVPAAIHEEGR